MIGFVIGGTKCAGCIGEIENDEMKIVNKKTVPTNYSITPYEMIDKMCELAENMTNNFQNTGISCGGPLDSKNGVILSPPNLPG